MTTVNQVLIPELDQLRAQIETIRETVTEATLGLTSEQMVWSPAPDTWSIGQVLDHLNLTATYLLPGIDAALAELCQKNDRSEGPFRYNLMERLFIRMISPNPPMKLPVPGSYTPHSAPSDLVDVVPAFQGIQEELQKRIVAANGLNLRGAQIVSPVDSRIRLCLGAWLQGIVAHERYHLLQAQAVRSALNPSA